MTGGLGKMIKVQNDTFYIISGSHRNTNIVKCYLVLITLVLSNHVVCFYEE